MTAFETDGSDSQYLPPIDDDTNYGGHSVDYRINTNIVTKTWLRSMVSILPEAMNE